MISRQTIIWTNKWQLFISFYEQEKLITHPYPNLNESLDKPQLS